MNKLKIVTQIPFFVLLKRILKRILSPFINRERIYYSEQRSFSGAEIKRYIDITELNVQYKPEVDSIINQYTNNTFNILGRGWQDLSHSKTDKMALLEELILPKHIKFSKQLILQLSEDYQLIDWQRNIGSDFRFDAKKLFTKQFKLINTKNIDIKFPWELGRLQHLPRLAFYAVNSDKKEQLITTFKNQTLDFIATNPVGMGVQWYSAMDVGIRLSNLLLAYDVFKKIDDDIILNERFDNIFSSAIYQHGKFIYNHLERKEGLGGNHYLFNLIGLLFAATYLEADNEIIKWKELAIKELEREFFRQFFEDGGNFEGSTAYHCLGAEMMFYATALMIRNGFEPSIEYLKRLYRCGLLVKHITKPNGKIVQFGDNDSGRLFKLSFIKDKKSGEESVMNYESILAAYYGVFGEDEFADYAEKFPIEKLVIDGLIKKSNINPLIPVIQSKTDRLLEKGVIPKLRYSRTTEIKYPRDINLSELAYQFYPDFGVYIVQSAHFYLAISAISNKKMHHSWGHVHNDKLSFELNVGGKDLVVDPGTYCYFYDIEKRNEFRSTKAHHSILVDGVEQNKWIKGSSGLFYLDRESKCELLSVSNHSISLIAKYYEVEHVRSFQITSNKLIIDDFCNYPFRVNINAFKQLSEGYGIITNSNG